LRSTRLNFVSPMTDNNARVHIAANDPAFHAKREAAVQMICAAITAIATPFGYTQTGTNWARSTPAGRSVINLHRNRFGWDCTLNLRFLTPDGGLPANSAWTQDDDIRINRFCLQTAGPGPENDVLAYLDIYDDPSRLDLTMQALRDRALPWLDAHHSGLPDIARYLAEPAPIPKV